MMSDLNDTPANTAQLPPTDTATTTGRTVSTCSSNISSTEYKDTEILTLKSTVSHLKNENFELTENIHRQNMAFISWQKSVDEELEYLQKELLSSRQKRKYEAWKEERRKRNTNDLAAKVEKIEKSDVGLKMGDISCGLVSSGKVDLDKNESFDECGSTVSLDKIHNDRQMMLNLRVERDKLLSDNAALTLQYTNSQQFTNAQHEQITALQNQVEELLQFATELDNRMKCNEFEKTNIVQNTQVDNSREEEEQTIPTLESLVLSDTN